MLSSPSHSIPCFAGISAPKSAMCTCGMSRQLRVAEHIISLSWEQAFRESRWFTRGWTLQELLAPRSVEFFSVEGSLLGNKRDLARPIHGITGIPIKALLEYSHDYFSVNQRRSWATNRQTKREEDEAYCLLGILDVSIPACYGEGREKARDRLLHAIDMQYRGMLPLYNFGLTAINNAVDRT
jgi:hypothetical protein